MTYASGKIQILSIVLTWLSDESIVTEQAASGQSLESRAFNSLIIQRTRFSIRPCGTIWLFWWISPLNHGAFALESDRLCTLKASQQFQRKGGPWCFQLPLYGSAGGVDKSNFGLMELGFWKKAYNLRVKRLVYDFTAINRARFKMAFLEWWGNQSKTKRNSQNSGGQ